MCWLEEEAVADSCIVLLVTAGRVGLNVTSCVPLFTVLLLDALLISVPRLTLLGPELDSLLQVS